MGFFVGLRKVKRAHVGKEAAVSGAGLGNVRTEQRQTKIGGQPGYGFKTEKGAVRGPGIVGRIRYQPGFDWIEMDVPEQHEKVRIDIDESCVVTTLKQVTAGAQSSMAIARIARSNRLHDLAQRLVSDLHQGMQVIGHPAECVDPGLEPSGDLCEESIEVVPIGRRGEERLTMVASQDDVIAAAGNM